MATYETTEEREPYTPEFDYSVWTPNTSITLTNVPWDSSYRDVVRFDSTQARDTWFQNRVGRVDSARLTGFVYLKYGEPVMVPLPFSQCNQMNYLIAENPIQPVPTRSSTPARKPDKFYYFVQDVQYVAPNTTALIVQLDVWMTYYDRITFGRSYITRGHIAASNKNLTLYNMADYIQDPEGLEYGDEYDVVHQEFFVLNKDTSGADTAWFVLVISNTDLTEDWGSTTKPELKTAKGCNLFGVPIGCDAYLVHGADIPKFFRQLQDAPWVSQGIVSMTCIPSWLVYPLDYPTGVHLGGKSTNVVMYRPNKRSTNTRDYMVQNTFRHFYSDLIGEGFYNYLKLWQFPYCFIEMTTYQGNPVVLKPQYMRILESENVDGTTFEQTSHFKLRSCLTPPNMKFVYWPHRYNGRFNPAQSYTSENVAGLSDNVAVEGGEFLDASVSYEGFPQLATVNNMYTYYLASNANSIAYQYSNASWAQQKSLTAANNALNLADASMGNQQANQDVSNNLAMKQTGIALEQNAWSGIKGIASGGIGAVGSLVSGNLGGAAQGALAAGTAYLDMTANADWTTRTTTNQLSAANQALGNNLAYQRQVADTNYTYANYAANGDYQQAIQGIQATVRDAQLTQPSVSGQLNGSTYNVANGIMGVFLKWKRIKPQYLRQIGQYFQRYGYYVNRFLVPPADLKCMSKFTYWQMRDCVIFGMIPETFKQTIRGIFESGVTVWVNPDEIGKISYDANTFKGVSY